VPKLVSQASFQKLHDLIWNTNLLLPQNFRETILEDLGVELPGLTLGAMGFAILEELIVAVGKFGV
jgi:hypothetical protein